MNRRTFPTTPYDQEQWFSIAEAAERLGMTELAVRRHVQAGSLHAKRDQDGWKVFLPIYHAEHTDRADRAKGTIRSSDIHPAELSPSDIDRHLEDIEQGRRPLDSLHDTVVLPLIEHNASLIEKARALEREVGHLEERERVLSEQIAALQREIAELRAGGGGSRSQDTSSADAVVDSERDWQSRNEPQEALEYRPSAATEPSPETNDRGRFFGLLDGNPATSNRDLS